MQAPLGVAQVGMLGIGGRLESLPQRIHVDPGVQAQTAMVGAHHRQGQGIVAGVGARLVTPGLELAAVEAVGLAAHLEEDVGDAQVGGRVEAALHVLGGAVVPAGDPETADGAHLLLDFGPGFLARLGDRRSWRPRAASHERGHHCGAHRRNGTAADHASPRASLCSRAW